jgi:uncharacterized protein (UPF0297 family)
MKYKGEHSWVNEHIDKYNQDLAEAKSFEEQGRILDRLLSFLFSNDYLYVPRADDLRKYLSSQKRKYGNILEKEQLKRLKGEILRASDLEHIEEVIEDIIKVRKDHLWETVKPDESEGKFDIFFSLLEKARLKATQDITKRVSRAKKDKELEALAHDVGTLQAQPEYVKEYGKVLNGLQAKIEEKYSVVGKGLNYLKRLFSRGRRASQVRVASQMNRELQREIRELKRDLRK